MAGRTDYGSDGDNRYQSNHIAHDLLRNLFFFVSRYLKYWYLKRYVGGLVHSMNKQLHIDLLGLLLFEGVR